MACLTDDETAKLVKYVTVLKAELQKSGVSIEEETLTKALLTSVDNLGEGTVGCDQCANGWKW